MLLTQKEVLLFSQADRLKGILIQSIIALIPGTPY